MAEKGAIGGILDTIIDKIVLAAMVTAVSTFLLYGYTAYSKAFDNIQVQSRATSDLAITLRDAVLKQSAKLTGDIKLAYLTGKRLSDDEHKAALGLVGDLARDAQILSAIFPGSSKIASDLASTLQKDVFFFQTNDFTQARLQALQAEVAKLLQAFIREFNGEMGKAAANEFRDIFNAFQQQVPWQFQPVYILLGCVVALIVLLAAANLWRILSTRSAEKLTPPAPPQHYFALIQKDPHGCYGATFPDVPSVVSAGRTLAETIQNATDALSVALAQSDKQPDAALPRARSVDELFSDPVFQGQAARGVIAAIPLRGTGA
jgi:predicted RNase H-like HicB family nuclease